MIPLKYISANTWHPISSSNKRIYPSPQSILRQAIGTSDYKFHSEGASLEHIRAAVIMPRNTAYQHLLAVPWALTYTTPNWVMIIASVEDQLTWIDIARASGAIGYLRSHAKCTVWSYHEPEFDEHGLKVRPRTAVDLDRAVRITCASSLKGKQRKNYDKESLIEDLKIGNMTHPELGAKYGLSRLTVLKIAHDAGIRHQERIGIK